jgi:hypothetical protein
MRKDVENVELVMFGSDFHPAVTTCNMDETFLCLRCDGL